MVEPELRCSWGPVARARADRWRSRYRKYRYDARWRSCAGMAGHLPECGIDYSSAPFRNDRFGKAAGRRIGVIPILELRVGPRRGFAADRSTAQGSRRSTPSQKGTGEEGWCGKYMVAM